jgi:hypothetical protein
MYLGGNLKRADLIHVTRFLIPPRSRGSRSSSTTRFYSLPPAAISNAVLYPCSSGLRSRSDTTRPLTFRVTNPSDGV